MLHTQKLIASIKNKRNFILSSVVSLCFRITSVCVGFLLSIVISKKLGYENVGYYFFSVTLITFFSTVSRLGLDGTIVKFSGRYLGLSNRYDIFDFFKKSFIFVFFVSTFFYLFLYNFSSYLSIEVFNKPKLGLVLNSMSLSIIFVSLSSLMSYIFQGFRYVMLSVITLNIITPLIILLIILFLDNLSLTCIGYIYTISSVFCFFVSLLCSFFVYRFKRPNQTFTKVYTTRDIYLSANPLWVSSILSQLVLFVPQSIGAYFLTGGELSVLSVVIKVSTLASFLLVAVNVVVAPRIATFFSDGKINEVSDLIKFSIRMMLALSSPIFLFLFFFSDFILGVFGQEFSSYTTLLYILLLGQAVNLMSGSVSHILSMSGNERDLKFVAIVSACFSLVLCLLLGDAFGLYGVGCSIAITVILQNVLSALIVKKRIGINVFHFW